MLKLKFGNPNWNDSRVLSALSIEFGKSCDSFALFVCFLAWNVVFVCFVFAGYCFGMSLRTKEYLVRNACRECCFHFGIVYASFLGAFV